MNSRDRRYAELRDFMRRLFPELVCPEHNEVGTPAISSKPTRYVWCAASGAKGHWFKREALAGDGE